MQYAWRALVAIGLLFEGGCNECHFGRRCVGDELQRCGGVDQVIGRKLSTQDCRVHGLTCFDRGSDVAACVVDPPEECDPEAFEGSCRDSATVLSCDHNVRRVTATRCEVGNECTVRSSMVDGQPRTALCAALPVTTCSAPASHCKDNAVFFCHPNFGVFQRTDCGTLRCESTRGEAHCSD